MNIKKNTVQKMILMIYCADPGEVMVVAKSALVATVRCAEAAVDEVAWDVVDAVAEAAAVATSEAAAAVGSSGRGANLTGILDQTRAA